MYRKVAIIHIAGWSLYELHSVQYIYFEVITIYIAEFSKYLQHSRLNSYIRHSRLNIYRSVGNIFTMSRH
jgi:hypothetical protein